MAAEDEDEIIAKIVRNIRKELWRDAMRHLDAALARVAPDFEGGPRRGRSAPKTPPRPDVPAPRRSRRRPRQRLAGKRQARPAPPPEPEPAPATRQPGRMGQIARLAPVRNRRPPADVGPLFTGAPEVRPTDTLRTLRPVPRKTADPLPPPSSGVCQECRSAPPLHLVTCSQFQAPANEPHPSSFGSSIEVEKEEVAPPPEAQPPATPEVDIELEAAISCLRPRTALATRQILAHRGPIHTLAKKNGKSGSYYHGVMSNLRTRLPAASPVIRALARWVEGLDAVDEKRCGRCKIGGHEEGDPDRCLPQSAAEYAKSRKSVD